jgi:hypothetical protein
MILIIYLINYRFILFIIHLNFMFYFKCLKKISQIISFFQNIIPTIHLKFFLLYSCYFFIIHQNLLNLMKNQLFFIKYDHL